MDDKIIITNEKAAELLAAAEETRKNAYAPYSGFAVGAALLFEDGTTVTGCNVENSSYGLSLCAERNAMSSAVAIGLTHPIAAAVAGPDGVFCPPCGSCRQFLAEFNREMAVIVKDVAGMRVLSLDNLLPSGFSLKGE